MHLPKIAILGRPNVGKSTLFTRIGGLRKAIVDSIPGVTRDRIYGEAEWRGRKFSLIDTGGLDLFGSEGVSEKVKEQVFMAIKDADLLLFVVDVKSGLTPLESEIALHLRKHNKPIILVINKVDHPGLEKEGAEFYQLGFALNCFVSAEHRRGLGELLDLITAQLPPTEEEEEKKEESEIKIAVIGRTNVGKSSIVNRILGEERVLVSEEPGTTRDSIDTLFTHKNSRYRIIDTAGIRRKRVLREPAEIISVLKARQSLERSDVVLLLIDATEGVTSGDAAIGSYAEEKGRGIVILVNKWDLIPSEVNTPALYLREMKRKIPFLHYAPVLFISAKTGQRVFKIFDLVQQVTANQNLRVPTPLLNQVIHKIISPELPSARRRGRPRVLYGTQVDIKPPRFIFFVNNPRNFTAPYRRHLTKQVRKAFSFYGTPIKIELRKR